MNKTLYLLVFFFCLFWVSGVAAQEQIDSFAVQIEVNQNASLLVKEEIVYDFGFSQNHGIYRDIPITYHARGGKYKIDLAVVAVTDREGEKYQYTVSKSGQNQRLKIGDPNFTVSGKKVYQITYQVVGALNYFREHDELYWNVTGHDWAVPITKAAATVQLPSPADNQTIKIDCFQGSQASSAKCESATVAGGVVYFNQSDLLPGEGLTVVVGWPKGTVYQPTPAAVAVKTIKDNFILFLPLAFLFGLIYLWYTRGRDPEGDGTIIPRYQPPDNLTPAEVGAVVDERVNRRDVISTIIDLAVKGYLRITRLEKKRLFGQEVDYKLELLKPAASQLSEHEKIFLAKLFSQSPVTTPLAAYISADQPLAKVNLSELKQVFYKHLQEIEKSIYRAIVAKKYFLKNPDKVRTAYIIIGFLIMLIGIPLGIINGFFWLISFISSGLLVIIFGFFMPVKTVKGAQAREYILGLKQYLSVAEKDRLRFHNAPEKNPELFEKLLPYAIALKVDNLWAEQFKDIYQTNPGWYVDGTGGQFNSLLLVSGIHQFTTQANSVLSSFAQSAGGGGSGLGGGGFSGGGFGGGGGGSW